MKRTSLEIRGRHLGELNPKYRGIYEYQAKSTQTIRFRAILRVREDSGKSRQITKTFEILEDAYAFKLETRAKALKGELKLHARKTLEDLVEIMLASRKRKRSLKDIKRYYQEILDYFGNRHHLRLTEVQIEAFKLYLDQRPKRTRTGGFLSNSSKDHIVGALRSLLIKAKKMKVIDYIPEIEMYGNHGRRKLELNLVDFGNIVQLLPDPPKPHKALLIMELFTGQRWGDIASMTRNQIQGPLCKGSVIRYRSSKTNKNDIVIYMPAVLALELNRLAPYWVKGNPYLFPNPATGKPYSSFKKVLEKIGHRLELPHFTFHHFRHLATSLLMEISGNEERVKKILGWSDNSRVMDLYNHHQDRMTPELETLEQRYTQITNHIQPHGETSGARPKLSQIPKEKP